MILFTNPSAWVGYDTRSISKRSLTGLNSEFSFSSTFMIFCTDLVHLLLDGGGGGSFIYSLLPYLFSSFLFSFFPYTEYLILVWESVNNSTLVPKIDFHVPIVLASDQVQILIWIYPSPPLCQAIDRPNLYKTTSQQKRLHLWKQHFENLQSYTWTNHNNYKEAIRHQTRTIYSRRTWLGTEKN